MKKMLLWLAICMVALCARAQKIEVVDSDGYGIPYASVLTAGAEYVGITDLEGVLPDVKGAKSVVISHVAFKPKEVKLDGKDVRVTLEDADYSLEEIVVEPKPLVYVETYYRVYGFADNSLRYYLAGIMPNAYDVEKKKVKSGSYMESYGDFCLSTGIGITWGARAQKFNAGKIHKSGAIDFVKGGKTRDYYFVTLTDEGKGRQRVSNQEGTVGFIETEKGEVHMTLDAGKMQMYRNKALGQNSLLKRREKVEYDYVFNEVFNIDEGGDATIADLVMSSDHWEWNGGKGRMKFIIETYATKHAYIDAKGFKEKKRELKKTYVAPMKLDALETYAASHGIPALTPTMRRAIEELKK